MKLLVFIPGKTALASELERVLEGLGTKIQPEIHRTIESLFWRMRQPVCDVTLAVLVAGNREDLANLLDIGHLLQDLRIFLILPDEAEETIASGHFLRPRLLSFASSELADVEVMLRQHIEAGRNNGMKRNTMPERPKETIGW